MPSVPLLPPNAGPAVGLLTQDRHSHAYTMISLHNLKCRMGEWLFPRSGSLAPSQERFTLALWETEYNSIEIEIACVFVCTHGYAYKKALGRCDFRLSVTSRALC